MSTPFSCPWLLKSNAWCNTKLEMYETIFSLQSRTLESFRIDNRGNSVNLQSHLDISMIGLLSLILLNQQNLLIPLLFYPEIGERSSEAMGGAEHDGGVARDQDGATTEPPDDDVYMRSYMRC